MTIPNAFEKTYWFLDGNHKIQSGTPYKIEEVHEPQKNSVVTLYFLSNEKVHLLTANDVFDSKEELLAYIQS